MDHFRDLKEKGSLPGQIQKDKSTRRWWFLTVETRQDTKKDKDKSQHFIDVVNDNLHQPRKLWNILKDIGSKTLHKVKYCSIGLYIDGVLCYDQVSRLCGVTDQGAVWLKFDMFI